MINQWKKMVFVKLFYDGPEDLKDDIEDALRSCGVFPTGGEVLYIKVFKDRSSGYYAVFMWFNGKKWDNFYSPSYKNNLEDDLKKGIKKIVGCRKPPKYGFIVKVSSEEIETAVSSPVTEPLILSFKSSDYYEVYLDGEATKMSFGFVDIGGRKVFVGKNDMKISTALFFKGVDDVYYSQDGWIKCYGGVVEYPDGKKIKLPSCPIDIVNGCLIYGDHVACDGSQRTLNGSFLGTDGKVLVLSNGSIESINGDWKTKVSCPVVEWSSRGEEIYILDICGFLTIFDVKKKKIVFKKRFSAAYGFDFYRSETYVGLPGKVVSISGGEVSKAHDFCVYDNKKVFWGDFIRSHMGICFKYNGRDFQLLERDFVLHDVRAWKIKDRYLIVYGRDGVWVIKGRR